MFITPNEWGPYGWKFIHYVARGYPVYPSDVDKESYRIFFEKLGLVLPCCICKRHYNDNLAIYPLTDYVLSSRISLIHWTIDMHNEANKSLNKPLYTYEEAIEVMDNNYVAKNTNTTPEPPIVVTPPESK